ncbi:MAG: acetyl-CoA carboxylase biotin carboxylase subunit [Gemmatimonadota bacterium]|jgi:acetyl-CoA carboxylase biotin carboxylase subunit|nr:acetyl-CoA carboxylase biotin carboxylase subunit [Gemmatimonadota bacterium]
MIRKILVANRGEIALRIIRAARELGVRTVAVFSDADRLAPYVAEADEAIHLGPSPSSESYLRGDRLIEAALHTGADAIHPGYGFLSEQAPFIRAVEAARLIFIGPPATAVEQMGDKTAARRTVTGAGVPVVPGTDQPLATPEEAAATASRIGYPVLLKAAAGGGGKGMRLVREAGEMPSAFAAATHEACSAFGDGAVYLEKYLEGPRHIEIQLLADAYGTILHLGERECSIQRRHQKLIEEAPSPVLTPEQRAEMGETAIAIARSVGYRGAGTVEFLWQDGLYYFLEMNTRIQVEHPVTELVTGIDLVHWQIRIASGEALPFTQSDITLHGHAMECRITSENPADSFLPSTGRIEFLSIPSGPGVRWDGGVAAGSEISLYYDPLLAKLIVHASTRTLAVERMRRALMELQLVGVETSASFHLAVMEHPGFRAGEIDILWFERHAEALLRTATGTLRAGKDVAAGGEALPNAGEDAQRNTERAKKDEPRPDATDATTDEALKETRDTEVLDEAGNAGGLEDIVLAAALAAALLEQEAHNRREGSRRLETEERMMDSWRAAVCGWRR